MDLHQIIRRGIEQKASDIHFTNESPPLFRIDGVLVPETDVKLGKSELVDIVKTLTGQRFDEYMERGELDFTYQADTIRLRVNVFRQRGVPAAALRLIAGEIPTFESLALPPVIETFANMQQGLVLFTGPTGSGKSTTLAALINQINNTRACHIITLEDPIEFLHQHNKAVINQREVGKDTRSFSAALRSALRQDPDVILVGELRDPDTISTAITAAETGHLVLATLHTSNSPGAVDRIIDSFPGHQQQQIRTQLADTLRAIVAQRLLPKKDETGRVVVCEVLIGTSGVKNLIREGKIHQIPTQMETGSNVGMQTFDQSLKKLQDMGLIESTSF